MAQETNRRSFLTWALFGMGAIFTAILGIPVAAYVIDPRHRKGKPSDFKLVEGVRLDELPDKDPRQGVIRDTRRDGWTLYPNDIVGRVWVVMLGGAKPAANANQETKNKYLLVFTTICPHLGCSVNLNEARNAFLCPCHSAAFTLEGERTGAGNPAQRGMDTLDWQFDPTDDKRILVRYQNFVASDKNKVIS